VSGETDNFFVADTPDDPSPNPPPISLFRILGGGVADRTGAERQARYRAHKRGNHSRCDPDRCDGSTVTVTPRVTRDSVTPSPTGLGTRGRRLWRDVLDEGELAPAERVLLEEACRLADRLDRLDQVLRGDIDVWMRLLVDDDAREAEIVVDKVLSEARQQQVALKQLLAELRQSRGTAGAAPRRGMGGQVRTSGTGARRPAGVKPSGGGVLADLTSRLAGRGNSTAG
jgi:hypothetical protein